MHALEHYDLEVTRLRLVTNSWNCVFRVDSTAGPFALRVTIPRTGDEVSVAAETAFMNALGEGTDIRVPTLLHTRDGELYADASAPGVPEPRSCVVFGWLGGRDLGDEVTPENWEKLGELMARMHVFSSTWSMPAHHAVPLYDSSTPYDERLMIFDEGIDLFGLESLIAEAKEATDQRIAAINQRVRPMIVHGDLHQWNVKVKRGVLSVFDFEDLLLAAPILDAATSLFYVRGEPNFAELAGAFRAGYERHLPWFETEPGELDRLFMARSLDLLNFVALQPELDIGDWEAFVRRRERPARVALGEIDPVEIV